MEASLLYKGKVGFGIDVNADVNVNGFDGLLRKKMKLGGKSVVNIL
jgi:hypothetical protein